MKFYNSDASPFARKVRILAAELKLEDRIEVIAANPWTDETLRKVNPLCKVPALVTDEGDALFDSRVICIYLDRLAGGSFVRGAPVTSLVMEALADGISDAGVRRMREVRREGGDGHVDVIERQNLAIRAAIDVAERHVPQAFDIGAIALIAALDYLDFRMPEDNWLAGHPKLKVWAGEVSKRPSIASTAPR